MRILELIEECDGALSFARTATGLVVLACIGWVTYLVVTKGALPELGGVAAFVGAIATTTYGLNKITTMMEKKENESKNPSNPSNPVS